MNEGKVVKLGAIGKTASGMGANAGMLSDEANKVLRVELKNRRELLSRIALGYADINHLQDYKQLSSKQLKRKSKGFALIYRYIEPLDLARFHNGFKRPTMVELRRIILSINSLLASKNFAALDFEPTDTDYFELAMTTLVVLKAISTKLRGASGVDEKLYMNLNLTAADISVRLYSMYIDTRMESAMEDENVIMR